MLMFEVKGDKPQWRVIYDRISRMGIGDVITIEELEALLPGVAVRPPFYHAVKKVEENLSRTFENVRGVGYKMSEPRNHEKLARDKHKGARKMLQKAQRKVASADRALLTPDERRRLDELEHHFARHSEMLKRLDDRQLKTERRVEDAEQRVALTEKEQMRLVDRVDEMESLLKRHGMLGS